MTYLANILPHPQKNRLIQLFGNNHYEKLYKQAYQTGTPFFKWNDWIKTQLDDAVEQYKLKSPLSFSKQSQMRPDHFKSDTEEQQHSHEVYR